MLESLCNIVSAPNINYPPAAKEALQFAKRCVNSHFFTCLGDTQHYDIQELMLDYFLQKMILTGKHAKNVTRNVINMNAEFVN